MSVYSSVPSPIFLPCSMAACQQVSGCAGMQMVVVVRVAALSQGAPRQDRLAVDRLDARKVERNGVKRGEHAHIRHHRHVILLMAVAVRGDIARDGDMEAGSSVDNRLRIFRDLVVEHLNSLIVIRRDRVLGTDGDTPAAADALVVVNPALFVRDDGRAVGADLRALAAADAVAPFPQRACPVRAFPSCPRASRRPCLDS